MIKQDIYLIYDIGKTNKKVLIFSSDGTVLDEFSEPFEEITDEDGFYCDDLTKLKEWVLSRYDLLKKNSNYCIKAINFATYGASLVHIDAAGNPITALYNYLKPIPATVKEEFLASFFNNSAQEFALQTSSPFMGMLNSGVQLYWLKHTKPAVWNQVAYSLHLPQYLSYLFTGKVWSDYTSVGCHTGLWDITNNTYHSWVLTEEIEKKLAPLNASAIAGKKEDIIIGTGLHDSSAALIPYLQKYQEPFILISTGTWCVNLNPFNTLPLTAEELSKDCLCYLQANGNAVKASRIFLGREHEYQAKRIATHFLLQDGFYKSIHHPAITEDAITFTPACMEGTGPQPHQSTIEWNLSNFQTAEQAYTALMKGLTDLLKQSIDLVDTPDTTHFYIDGGFAANPLFRFFLQQHYPRKKISNTEFAQATSLGAFLHLKAAI